MCKAGMRSSRNTPGVSSGCLPAESPQSKLRIPLRYRQTQGPGGRESLPSLPTQSAPPRCTPPGESPVGAPVYTYAWGNNARRAELKGRPCYVRAAGRMGTVLLEMLDTGERVTTSRRAIRKVAA